MKGNIYIMPRINDLTEDRQLFIKLRICLIMQEFMSSLNDYYIRNETCFGYPAFNQSIALSYDNNICPNEKLPFSQKEIEENESSLKDIKKQIIAFRY